MFPAPVDPSTKRDATAALVYPRETCQAFTFRLVWMLQFPKKLQFDWKRRNIEYVTMSSSTLAVCGVVIRSISSIPGQTSNIGNCSLWCLSWSFARHLVWWRLAALIRHQEVRIQALLRLLGVIRNAAKDDLLVVTRMQLCAQSWANSRQNHLLNSSLTWSKTPTEHTVKNEFSSF